MKSISTASNFKSALKTILLAGTIAGTLDILAAILVYAWILGKTSAVRILQSIASGVFGKQSFESGAATALYGLIFHYLIAFSWTIAFVLLFPYIPFLRKQKIIGGLLYGAIIWLAMNLVVLPLSNVAPRTFTPNSILIGVITLMLCVGLPISLITHRYYAAKS